MQVLRQSLTSVIQRPIILSRLQQIRYEGSDPRSSTSSDNHKSNTRDLNKSKGGDKKQKSSTTDDTQQPGTTRKDWNRPNQTVGNDPQYGKAGRPNSPKAGEK